MLSQQSYSQNGSVTTALPLSASNPQSLKTYFEKVRELIKSGDAYPVNLNDVWPLCYVEKGVAVRFLKKQFLEGYDYQSFDKKVKRGTGATTSTEYSLSVSCMEFFIARKVRTVFDVYREVFHRVADMVEQTLTAKVESLVQLNNSLTQRMIKLESMISRMDKAQNEYFEAKVTEDATEYEKDILIRRTKVMSAISLRLRIFSSQKWSDYWDAFQKAYDIDIRSLKQEKGEHLIDTAIRYGHLEKIEELLNWQ